MDRFRVGLAGVFAVLAVSGAARAATVFQFTMQGTVTFEGPPNVIPGVDPSSFPFIPVDIHPGDTVTMSARFSSNRMIPSAGGFIVPLQYLLVDDCDPGGACTDSFLPGLPVIGPENFSVRVNSLVYPAQMEIFDGTPIFETRVGGPGGHLITFDYGLPTLTFDANGRFLNLGGRFEPGDPTPIPNFRSSGATFQFDNAGIYSFNPNMHAFRGTWDVAGAVLAQVPEPGTWTLVIVGLTGLGSALRRRRTSTARVLRTSESGH